MKSGSSACFCNGSFSCTEAKLSLRALELVKKGNTVGPHYIAALDIPRL